MLGILDEALRRRRVAAEPTWIVPARLARAEAQAGWRGDSADLAPSEAEVPTAGRRLARRSVDAGRPAIWLPRLGAPLDPPLSLAEPYRLAEIAGDWRGARRRLWTGWRCPYEAALAL